MCHASRWAWLCRGATKLQFSFALMHGTVAPPAVHMSPRYPIPLHSFANTPINHCWHPYIMQKSNNCNIYAAQRHVCGHEKEIYDAEFWNGNKSGLKMNREPKGPGWNFTFSKRWMRHVTLMLLQSSWTEETTVLRCNLHQVWFPLLNSNLLLTGKSHHATLEWPLSRCYTKAVRGNMNTEFCSWG